MKFGNIHGYMYAQPRNYNINANQYLVLFMINIEKISHNMQNKIAPVAVAVMIKKMMSF